MTSRERMLACARGAAVDRQPVVAWPGGDCVETDAIVCGLQDYDRVLRENGGNPRPPVSESSPVLMVEVSNPFGRALGNGLDLNALLANEPEKGGAALDALVDETREDLVSAFDGDADGVVYLLHGACEKHCSPMQYGGHYLEKDRELLESLPKDALNLLFVVGDRDLYLDFVSDLPAPFFGWDNRTSGISAAEGRAIRGGPVATFESGSDLLLTSTGNSAANLLENIRLESIV